MIKSPKRNSRNPLNRRNTILNVPGLSSTGDRDDDLPRFRFGHEDSSSTEDLQPQAPVRKKAIRNRRSSIPEAFSFQAPTILHEAAKKFMQSNSEKKLALARQPRQPEVTQLLPKRSEAKKSGVGKTLHLNVYDLPDLEEKGEEGTFSPSYLRNENEENVGPYFLAQQPTAPSVASSGNSSNAHPPSIDTTQDIALWWELVSK
ncbi:hypothetical protein GCK32_017593 [Trichostrongylus colubriformis]|uniref:Uncharacterized protein n=1 Tax=Trichostrongylus colubriformis TaxID=6319 RepID=A0AAN8IH36_TRICO